MLNLITFDNSLKVIPSSKYLDLIYFQQEKCALGAILVITPLIVPLWCATNFNKWRPASN